MDAQATLANIQKKDVSQSIFQLVNMVLDGRTEKEIQKAEVASNYAFKEVEEAVNAFGDSQFLNDALYENYLTMTRYYDDDFEKTAAFMDLMSLDEVNENYIGVS